MMSALTVAALAVLLSGCNIVTTTIHGNVRVELRVECPELSHSE